MGVVFVQAGGVFFPYAGKAVGGSSGSLSDQIPRTPASLMTFPADEAVT